ncbi:MAG: hypothetical protein QM740_21275 [Acidovorax sp.]
MNEVVFKVQNHETSTGHKYSSVSIFVNHQSLAEIMKTYELPMATREGHPNLAGAYAALAMPSLPEKYYLGEHNAYWGDGGNKTALLDCECGCSGCWPLLCKISCCEDKVIWSNFEQPHRTLGPGASHWDYSKFEGFIFDRNQYMRAVESLKNI